MMNEATIGIIGGSGLYRMDGLTDVSERTVDTPYGPPSDAIVPVSYTHLTLPTNREV